MPACPLVGGGGFSGGLVSIQGEKERESNDTHTHTHIVLQWGKLG